MAKNNNDANSDGFQFNMSDDQVQAMKELEIRESRDQDDSDWTEEKDLEFYNYLITDEPDHGVKERLARINAELDQEPDPKPEKERSVIFKEELVSLVVPPEDTQDEEDYTETAEENELGSRVNYDSEDSNRSSRNQMNGMFTDDNSDEISEEITLKHNDSTINSDLTNDGQEDFVVERNGRFQMAGKDDYESSGRNYVDDIAPGSILTDTS